MNNINTQASKYFKEWSLDMAEASKKSGRDFSQLISLLEDGSLLAASTSSRIYVDAMMLWSLQHHITLTLKSPRADLREEAKICQQWIETLDPTEN
jgi:hypothetical protein